MPELLVGVVKGEAAAANGPVVRLLRSLSKPVVQVADSSVVDVVVDPNPSMTVQ